MDEPSLEQIDEFEQEVKRRGGQFNARRVDTDLLLSLLSMARECLLARNARPMLDGWRTGLERERDEARAEVAKLRAEVDHIKRTWSPCRVDGDPGQENENG